MKKLLPAMPRREIIAASLEARGALIETRGLEEACTLANGIAPEHLELSVEDPQAWLPKLKHAGAIFLGRWSSEAIGDYRSEEHTSELQSPCNLVCRLLLEKKKKNLSIY